MNEHIVIGKAKNPVHLLGEFGNRHGLVAGATGTGKTVTLMTMAEGFSRMGTPVFVADVKGDMSGLAMAGERKEKIVERVNEIGIDNFEFAPNPVALWDLWGRNGVSIRVTVKQVGSTLLSRMLELNDTQEGVLEIAFHYAKKNHIRLETLDDLRGLMVTLSENRETVSRQYGLVSDASIGAIQRNVLQMENAGIDKFFGDPAFEFEDFMRLDESGHGYINILSAESLILKPRIYSTFLLWLLTTLFEKMPEIGDCDKPKMVFFFDEAHLLFDDCSKALLQRIEQVVRLIRSKGVGVYFCSQNPDDIPESVLGQLGNRIQHALRAFTPRDQKAVRAAAETFADNPDLDVRETITSMGVGEAMVSMLNNKGIPTPVQRAIISPPGCRLGPITDVERKEMVNNSPLREKYLSFDEMTSEQRLRRYSYNPDIQNPDGSPLSDEEIERKKKEKAEAKERVKEERRKRDEEFEKQQPEKLSLWQEFIRGLTFRD